jgi:uncharacterized protein DUF4411
MLYSIDTSGLLDGWRRFYPRDVFPTLWDQVEEFVDDGKIVASEEVYRELAKQDDDLHAWVKRWKKMLILTDSAIQTHVAQLLNDHPRLVDTLRNRSQADPFVIAIALELGLTVVTGELNGTAQRPRIPYVCHEKQIKCINFLQMIRELGLSF